MPKTALADTLEEWDSLLAALDNPEILAIPQMRALRDALEVMIRNTKALATEQIALQARRQAVTQELRITRGSGQDLVIQVKAALRGHFGHRFEGLRRYHIRPIRRRSRAVREEVGISAEARQSLRASIPGLPIDFPGAPEALGAPRTPDGAAPIAPESLPDPSVSTPDEI